MNLEKRLKYARLIALALSSSFFPLPGCGPSLERLKSAARSKDDRAGAADAEHVQVEAGSQNLRMTADYQPLPLDVIVVRASGAAFDAEPFALRISDAAATFAARLLYAETDVHVAFLDAGAADAPNSAARPLSGEIIGTSSSDAQIDRSRAEFRDVISKRLQSQPARSALQPLKALALALEKSAASDNYTTGFFRDGAFLAVIYLLPTDGGQESTTAEDLLAALDASKGRGNYAISAIAVDDGRCKGEAPKRSPIASMVAATDGLFAATCAPTFAYFFDQILDYGTRATRFRVDLPVAAVWSSLRVTAGDLEVKGWDYVPGSTELWLPRLVPSGAAFRVAFDIDDGTTAVTPPSSQERFGTLAEESSGFEGFRPTAR